MAPVPPHAARAGWQPPTPLEGRHRYDLSAEYGHQPSADPWRPWLSEGDPGAAQRSTHAVTQRRNGRSGWYWLLVVPIVAALLSPFYNRMEPQFGDMPFFYWFPLSLNVGAGACMLTVHLATRRGR